MYYQPFFIEIYAECVTDERRRQSLRWHRGGAGPLVRLIGVAAKMTRRLSSGIERWAAGSTAESLPRRTRAHAR
ncbi:MAG TPA: hypothetical protein VIK11_07030 [Tepidiformaceae bacterium]|jgi:hypothetical protein